MEAVGDSHLVVGDEIKELEAASVEFERNIEEFKESLEHEEHRLVGLEERRLKLQEEIEKMMEEVREEKAKYRAEIDVIITERERISRELIESTIDDDLSEVASSMSIIEECHEAIESTHNLDCTIELDIEKIRCDLMENFIATKGDYLNTMKEQLQQKQKRLESR